jgi:hypothetical protein
MKVYELMAELASMPAGAKVEIHLIKNENELSIFDEIDDLKTFSIIFEVQEVNQDNEGLITLDGY